jgi:hypothetical protein
MTHFEPPPNTGSPRVTLVALSLCLVAQAGYVSPTSATSCQGRLKMHPSALVENAPPSAVVVLVAAGRGSEP